MLLELETTMSLQDYDNQFLRNLGIEPFESSQGESMTTVTTNQLALEVAEEQLFTAINQLIENGADPNTVRDSVEKAIDEAGQA